MLDRCRWLGYSLLKKWLVSLPARFAVWLADQEARFLRGEYVGALDVDELKARANKIMNSSLLTAGTVGSPLSSA